VSHLSSYRPFWETLRKTRVMGMRNRGEGQKKKEKDKEKEKEKENEKKELTPRTIK
jgi:hypothetical protein